MKKILTLIVFTITLASTTSFADRVCKEMPATSSWGHPTQVCSNLVNFEFTIGQVRSKSGGQVLGLLGKVTSSVYNVGFNDCSISINSFSVRALAIVGSIPQHVVNAEMKCTRMAEQNMRYALETTLSQATGLRLYAN